MKNSIIFLTLLLIASNFFNLQAQQVKRPVPGLADAEIQQRYQLKKQATGTFSSGQAFILPAPEQDCIAAIPLCDSTYTQTNSYVGQGAIPNEIDPAASCLLSGEKNDVWYTFTVQSSGNLNFSITPINGNDDYDWALFNLTNHVCSDIFTTPSLEVSCNYAPNLGCGGITGPNNDTTGTCGGQNEVEVPVLAGQTYVINVSNFSSTQFGYTIDFGPSSAVIYDNVPPQPTVTGMNCTDSTFLVNYPTELLACATIASDGSDFYILDFSGNSYPVIAASGVGCSPSQPYVSQIAITLHASDVPFPGFYLLTQTGSDGNTFSDKCGNFAGDLGSTDTVAFVNVLNNIQVDIGPDTSLCTASVKPLLDAQNDGATFSWALNGLLLGTTSSQLQTSNAGTYVVTVTYGLSCSATDTMTLGLLPGFPFSLGPDTTICSGNQFPVLYTGITGAPHYSWFVNNLLIGTAQADSLLPLQPGTYVAVVDSGTTSCPGVDTIQVFLAFSVPFSLGNDLVLCEGDSVLLKAGINGSVNYLWNYNNTVISQVGDSIYASNQGQYSLTVETVDGCLSGDSIQITVDKISGPVLVSCPVNTGSSNVFNWDAVAGASGYEVSLDGITGWSIPSSGSNGLSHSTSLLTVHLFVRALSGPVCPPGPTSESLPCDIVIPNIITPDNDGKNDFFFIKNLEQYTGTKLKVLNRWGTIIYKSNDYKNNWDANHAPDGVYFYEINIQGIEKKTGTITIIRGGK